MNSTALSFYSTAGMVGIIVVVAGQGTLEGEDQISICRVRADLDRGSLIQDGREVALRPKTFHVLRRLVVQHGKLVSKDDLTAAVWTDTAVTDNSLSQCLFEIRKALGDESQTIIRTVARRGYVFAAPIEPDEPTGDASRLPPAAESPADLRTEPDRATRIRPTWWNDGDRGGR